MASDPGSPGTQGASNVAARQSRLPYPPGTSDFQGRSQVASSGDPYLPVHQPAPQGTIAPKTPRRSRTLLLVMLIVLATSLGGVLYAQGILRVPQRGSSTPQATIPAGGTPAKGGPTNAPTGPVITQNVPPTQLACPYSGAGRPAITAPLALGNHQNVVYIVNEEATATTPAAGTVKRRDITTNTRGIEIQKMLNTTISEAQVSNDGRC